MQKYYVPHKKIVIQTAFSLLNDTQAHIDEIEAYCYEIGRNSLDETLDFDYQINGLFNRGSVLPNFLNNLYRIREQLLPLEFNNREMLINKINEQISVAEKIKAELQSIGSSSEKKVADTADYLLSNMVSWEFDSNHAERFLDMYEHRNNLVSGISQIFSVNSKTGEKTTVFGCVLTGFKDAIDDYANRIVALQSRGII